MNFWLKHSFKKVSPSYTVITCGNGKKQEMEKGSSRNIQWHINSSTHIQEEASLNPVLIGPDTASLSPSAWPGAQSRVALAKQPSGLIRGSSAKPQMAAQAPAPRHF